MSKVEKKKKKQWKGLLYPDDTNAKLYILFRTDSHQISRTELALSLYGVSPGPLVQCISVTYPRPTAGRLRAREVKNHTLSSSTSPNRLWKGEPPCGTYPYPLEATIPHKELLDSTWLPTWTTYSWHCEMLSDVHEGLDLPSEPIDFGVVRGKYEFYHYKIDGVDDRVSL